MQKFSLENPLESTIPHIYVYKLLNCSHENSLEKGLDFALALKRKFNAIELSPTQFIVDHVCMSQSNGRGTLCFCEEDNCNSAVMTSAAAYSPAVVFLPVLLFLMGDLPQGMTTTTRRRSDNE